MKKQLHWLLESAYNVYEQKTHSWFNIIIICRCTCTNIKKNAIETFKLIYE
jgi:hypothetical protein